jgi:hypothetical protein
MFDAVLRIATTGMVGRLYGANEDLGFANFLSAFEGDALGVARTALSDTPASDNATLRLHGALMSLLRAYLPPRAAQQWREARGAFVFPHCLSQGWTELVRLWDLQCVIAQLTVAETHWVNRLDPPTWGCFLQILEDAASLSDSSRWIIGVLYAPDARNVTTRATMKSLLTAADPGSVSTGGGVLHALSREGLRCHRCGLEGHFARDCPSPKPTFSARVGGALSHAARVAAQREGLNALAQHSEQEMLEFDDYATRADMAYLNSRLDALVTSSAMAGTTMSQMTTLPPRSPHPPLIVGGPPPPGYIFVGRHHHGGPMYGSADTVAASMMHLPADAAAPGHAEDQ